MTSGQKIAFSLLTAIAVFTAFVLTVRTKLFNQLETKFYTQTKIEENTGQLNKISESCDSYISEILSLIESGDNAWVKQTSVRSYYVQNPSESDVNERRKLTEQLFNQIPSLSGIRIVDKNGKNVHFSTFDDTDILKQTGITKVYKNYPDIQTDADEIPFEIIEKNIDSQKSSVLFDEKNGRLILYVPFSWMDGLYSGLALFYLNIFDIEKDLADKNIITLGQSLSLFAENNMNGGFVFNIPAADKKEFRNPVLNYWKEKSVTDKNQKPEKLLQNSDGDFWVILSSTNSSSEKSVKISGVYTSDTFEISTEIYVIIYISIFISILLIVFLFFSFKRDPVIVLKKRIKKIQFAIIDEYLESNDHVDWGHVVNQLRLRKKDFSTEILKSLNVHSKQRKIELDSFLDKNWEEIFSIFDNKAKTEPVKVEAASADLSGAAISEIKKVVEEVLRNTVVQTAAVTPVVAAAPVVEAADDVEEIEEVEELAEDVEEIEDAEEVAEDVEEIEEVEELAEDVEEIEEVEELTEDVEEIEEIEELAEDVEEIEEVEELAEDVEVIEDAEEVTSDNDVIEEPENKFIDDGEPIEDLSEEVPEEDDFETLEDAEDWSVITNREFNLDVVLKNVPIYTYKENSDATYFEDDERFATVDSIFAEVLTLGSEYIPVTVREVEKSEFVVYKLPSYPVEAKTEIEIPVLEDMFYTMTPFGTNLDTEISELDSIEQDSAADKAIVENDGVFSISQNLVLDGVEQDKDFKALVDSIL